MKDLIKPVMALLTGVNYVIILIHHYSTRRPRPTKRQVGSRVECFLEKKLDTSARHGYSVSDVSFFPLHFFVSKLCNSAGPLIYVLKHFQI